MSVPPNRTRLLISGGPGSGCSSTAEAVGRQLRLPVLDSDCYFHKPTDPPFQEQYTAEERRERLGPVLVAGSGWILSGSIATWKLDAVDPTHGVFLNIPGQTRLERLMIRQRNRFGSRIDPGGDMQVEHESFMEGASGYEDRTDFGRNLHTDRTFLETHCPQFLTLTGDLSMAEIVAQIVAFTGGHEALL